VVRVLAAAVIAMVIAIVVGPRFIAFLRRKEYGQHIREEGPQHHVVKQGTPVMGGVLIMIAMSVGFLAMSKYTLPALTVFGVTLVRRSVPLGEFSFHRTEDAFVGVGWAKNVAVRHLLRCADRCLRRKCDRPIRHSATGPPGHMPVSALGVY